MESVAEGTGGRPRSPAVTGSILRAARELVEEQNFDNLTAEAVAARAGVGKAAIYRRWPNVWAVVVDAFLDDVSNVAPITERSTARESFRASMKSLAKAYRNRTGRLLCAVVGRAQTDQELREAVRSRWVEPRRQVARQLVRQGMASGELRADLDVDVVLDMLYGPIYHRLLVPYGNAAISDRFIDRVVDQVFDGLVRPGGE